jgi:hypothetical protein
MPCKNSSSTAYSIPRSSSQWTIEKTREAASRSHVNGLEAPPVKAGRQPERPDKITAILRILDDLETIGFACLDVDPDLER